MATVRNVFTPIYERFHSRQLLRIASYGIAICAITVGTLLAWNLLRNPAPTQLLPGHHLAWEIAQSVAQDSGVRFVTGAYLPDNHMLIYSRLITDDRSVAQQWATLQLEPFADRLAALPSGGRLTWIIELDNSPSTQEVMNISLQQVDDPRLYEFMSYTPPDSSTAEGAPNPPVTGAAQPQRGANSTAFTTQPATEARPVASTTNTEQNTEQASPTVTMPTDTIQTVTAQTDTVQTDTVQTDTAQTVTMATSLRAINFNGAGNADSGWRNISGNWTMVDGIFQQQDQNGYDFITMLDLPEQRHFSMDAKLRMVAGEMGGGFIYNAPTLTSRSGAQILDMDDNGRYLRWGYYDVDGAYVFNGGVRLEPGLADGNWHTLQLITHGARSTVLFDGQEVGQPQNISQAGYLGLVTSRAQVDFDDLVIMALPEAANAELAPDRAAAESISGGLQDNFDNGNIHRWRVLNGTWQFSDGLYQQHNTDSSDLGSISTFQGDRYQVNVRTRLVEGNMGAGVYFNMADREAKMRSQMVSYTANGNAVQWGSFDDGGNFVFQGSAPVPNGGDGEWHQLAIAVADGLATIRVDSVTVAEAIPLTYTSGYVGLFANQSKVDFDDFDVTVMALNTEPSPQSVLENQP